MKIIHFVSEVQNIGNYTPVFGIQKMLHPIVANKTMDGRNYTNVNINEYDIAIIGGAGLFHISFSDFWKFIGNSGIPIIIWGVGICRMHKDTPYFKQFEVKESYVHKEIIDRIKKNIILVNVRDNLTNNFYELDANVSYCPTAIYFKNEKELSLGKDILYVHHDQHIFENQKDLFLKYCTHITDNFFYNDIKEVIQNYTNSKLIVTTKLHGAIIANCLGRNYIAYSKDDKIKEYCDLYGGGICIKELKELETITPHEWKVPINIDYEKIESFGNKVKSIL